MTLSIVQVVLLAVIGMIMALVCKAKSAEMSVIISLGICLLLMFFMVQAFDALVSFIQKISGSTCISLVIIIQRTL